MEVSLLLEVKLSLKYYGLQNENMLMLLKYKYTDCYHYNIIIISKD
jgi:hypothetical protein